MARLVLLILLLAVAQAQDPQQQLKKTGSCGRCHVASVLEWSVSRHQAAGTDCFACHGESKGHVVDERNNVKPEKIPRGEAIAALCATCHNAGCPKTARRDNCQSCHHPHALMNPATGKTLQDAHLTKLSATWEAYSRHMENGQKLMKQASWKQARDAFGEALRQRPNDRAAQSRLKACERRLNPGLPGFEIAGQEFDFDTGLPVRVRVSGLGTEMVLIRAGELDIGSEKYRNSGPVHTVTIEPFYLGARELTQGEWLKTMGTNPSAFASLAGASSLPVEQISWNDGQEFLRRLNSTTPGAGFRLPTEAEWEYAARAGSRDDQAVGSLGRIAWFRETAGTKEDALTPHPAGSSEANRWGLHDMLGNVWEWCSSAFRPYPYDGEDGRESASAELRVVRGGSVADGAGGIDPALRHSERPDRKSQWTGMRLARSIPE